MDEIKRMILETQESLGNTAGIDPLLDRFKVGAIQAYNDLLKIDFSEEETNA